MTVLGVDISWYQDVNSTPQQIDFAKMKAAGVKFVYIRVAFGTVPDEDFEYNWREAKKAGLLRGGYCFWNYWEGASKASKQVAFWKSMLATDPGEMPPALDMERANENYPALPASSVCFDTLWQFHKMCEELRRRTKLYTNVATLWERLTPAPAWATTEVDLWLAQWYVQQNQLQPAPWPKVTTWQQGLGKAQGYDFGVESKDIDIDYFLGTEDELYKYAKVSAPPSDPKPPEEEPVTNTIFANFPKGVMLTNHTIDPTLIGGDFMVAYMGKGVSAYSYFHRQVQAAADAKKPLIALYDNDPLIMLKQYESLNLKKWKDEILDNQVIKELLGPMIQSGGVNRRIHALIITMDDIYEAPGKLTDPNWIYQTALALAYGVKKLYNIPVYLSINHDNLSALKLGPKDNFTTFLSKLVPYDEELQTGYEGVMSGIATFFNDPALPTTGTWDAIPFPSDGYNENLRDVKLKSGLGNAPKVNFLCYSAGRVTMPGVGGVAPLYLYMGSKAQLYKELNYTDESTPSDPPQPPPGNDDLPSDPSGVIAAINEVNNRIRELTEIVKTGFRLP